MRSDGEATRVLRSVSWRTDTFRTLAMPLVDLVGDKTAKALSQLDLFTLGDILSHVPRRYISGTENTELGELVVGETIAAVLTVLSAGRKGYQQNRMRLEVVLGDGKAHINATFFGRAHLLDYWERLLTPGARGIFVGKVGEFRSQLQLTHPDFVLLDDAGLITARANDSHEAMVKQVRRSGLVGIYPASAKLPTWQVAECVDMALDAIDALADPLPTSVRAAHKLPELRAAYEAVHHPDSLPQVDAALRRLRFDEALRLQLTMAQRRALAAARPATAVVARDDGLLAAFDARLPFELTDGQRAVSAELFADLAKPSPMQRLLQGEVGSGKTIVALRAMLAAVDAGTQAVLLAPTEVLAVQHFETIRALLGDLADGGTLGAPAHATGVELVTGAMSAISRRHALDRIAAGNAGLIIGTHALLEERVQFAQLGLVVVDEQHRFGVAQRAVLADRNDHPHVLVMTATPIPRSIAMTIFGDLSVSTLSELPRDRAEVQSIAVLTQVHPGWLPRVWERVREEVGKGRQVFVVCPRITSAEPDQSDQILASATVEDMAKTLRDGPLHGLQVADLHGRMSSERKREIMDEFAAGQIDVLVSTTVIEVGIDIPNASMMVILDADRFGISQLHQLRGRIGRGAYPGVCLLVSAAEPTSVAAERINAVAATHDGFELAELDLQQRREGNVLGATQAGRISALRLLSVVSDADLIAETRDTAEQLLADETLSPDVLHDMISWAETQADPEWLDRS